MPSLNEVHGYMTRGGAVLKSGTSLSGILTDGVTPRAVKRALYLVDMICTFKFTLGARAVHLGARSIYSDVATRAVNRGRARIVV